MSIWPGRIVLFCKGCCASLPCCRHCCKAGIGSDWRRSIRRQPVSSGALSIPVGIAIPKSKDSAMKLYFTPGACSLAPHIVAREAGLPIQLEKVDLSNRTTSSGSSFVEINPKGYVPALRLASGEVMTEVSALIQYLADQAPVPGLMPPAGTPDRYRMLE